MKLSTEDQAMLDGRQGRGPQEAMEFLVKLGEATEADEMVDVTSAHIFGDHHSMGPVGLELYEKFVGYGAKVKVPTSCELFSYNRDDPHQFELSADYYDAQPRIMEALKALDVPLYASCIFYLTQNVCRYGDNLAWIEGNATGFANSFVGARGNRENPVTSLFAAITGRIPRYGLLDPANRKGQVLIEVEPGLVEKIGADGAVSADFCALGTAIGDRAYERIPVVTGFPQKTLSNAQLKAIASVCSPSLAGTLILIEGLSPEAPSAAAAFGGRIPGDVARHRVSMQDVKQVYEQLSNAKRADIDGVITGCPFKTIDELRETARLLEGKRIRDGLFMWVLTDMTTYHLAKESGIVAAIERSGARVQHDMCPWTLPLEEIFGPGKVIACDSMKMIRINSGFDKPAYWFGTLRDCIEAGLSGRFESRRWN